MYVYIYICVLEVLWLKYQRKKKDIRREMALFYACICPCCLIFNSVSAPQCHVHAIPYVTRPRSGAQGAGCVSRESEWPLQYSLMG